MSEQAPSARTKRPRRVMAVVLLQFRLARLLRHRAELAELPLAVFETVGPREVVVEVSEPARQAGVRAGLTVTAARARCPALQAVPVSADEHMELEEAAEAALQVGPTVELTRPDLLRVEIGGSAHLFGGEADCIAELQRILAKLGFQTAVAVADGPDIAAACARALQRRQPARPSQWIVERHQGAESLARLPLTVVPASAEWLQRLERVGVRTFGQLAALPRRAVIRRFGEQGERWHQLAHGQDARALEPHRLVDVVEARVDFDEPTAQLEPVLFQLKALFDRLEQRMCGRGVAALRLRIALGLDRYSKDGEGVCVETIALGRPLRASAPLLAIARERLGELRLSAPIQWVDVAVLDLARYLGRQYDLLDRSETTGEGLDELLVRLGAAFGADAVFAASLAPRHRPETAYTRERFDPTRTAAVAVAPHVRPTALLEAPEALEWRGDRVRVLYRGELWRHRVLGVGPPERLVTEWWKQGMARDYHVMEVDGGARWWVYRDHDTGGWYLHGLFE